MNNPWNEINPPNNEIIGRLVDANHSLDLFWARDHLGHYLFIYEFDPLMPNVKMNFPELVGIKIAHIRADNNNSKDRLVLLLNEQSNWELFVSLCNDIVQATCKAQSAEIAVQTMLRRLDRWHEFLKLKRNEIMNEQEIKGLIGELLFIKEYLIPAFGEGPAIQFWQGPLGLPQDFNVINCAIEVKCQSGATTPYIRISSADQLCPQLPEMYLYVVTLGKSTPEINSSLNLPGLVSHIRDLLVMYASNYIEKFNDMLHMVGYMDQEAYLQFCFVLSDEKMFAVTTGFPRICPSDIHPGIVKLSYDISLVECKPFTGHPNWMEN